MLNIIIKSIILLTSLFALSCTTFEPVGGSVNSNSPSGQASEGAVLIDEGQVVQGPQAEVIQTSDRMAIILGPGGAKTFAQAGFIKELSKAEVPIKKIVGLEWGALISALYSSKGQAHEIEWQLFKMDALEQAKEKSFLSILRKQENPQEVWSQFLSEIFAGQSIDSMALPWSCAYDYNGIIRFASSGDVAKAVEKCFFFPPNVKNTRHMAAPDALAKTVSELKKEGYGPIVYVDVMSGMSNRFKSSYVSESDKILWRTVQRSLEAQANLLDIEHVVIKTSSYMDDFESKNIMIKKGEGEAKPFISFIANKYNL